MVRAKAKTSEQALLNRAGLKHEKEQNFAVRISKMLGKLKYVRDKQKTSGEQEKQDRIERPPSHMHMTCATCLPTHTHTHTHTSLP